jgi:hypothetical protein
MSSVQDGVKDLISESGNAEFSIPVSDGNLKYTAKFGQPDSLIRETGIVVETGSANIQLAAAFNGQLFFDSTSHNNKLINQLRLRIAPAEALALCAIHTGFLYPVEICYMPVDQNQVTTAVKKLIDTQKELESSSTDGTNGFLKSGAGIWVKTGQSIGASDGQRIVIQFRDSHGIVLNPIFLLWSWWNESKKGNFGFSPSNHSLINSVLNGLNLKIEKHQIVNLSDPGAPSLGPIGFWVGF